MSQKIFHYTRDGVTVVWQPEKCIHSAVCFHGLPGVFDPRRRPWVDMSQAPVDQIIAQVGKCPSGALSFEQGETGSPTD